MLLYLLIALLVVLVLGVLYGAFLRGAPDNSNAWRSMAQTSFLAGIIAIVLTALAAILSFTDVLEATPFNGPISFAVFLAIPIALVGIGFGVIGLKSEARNRAIAGLALSAACIILWTIMEIILS